MNRPGPWTPHFGWYDMWTVNTELLIRFSFTVKCWCQNQCEWLHRFCKFSTSTFFSHWDTLVRGSQNCSCSLDSLEIQNIVKKQNWDRLRNLQVVVQETQALPSYIQTGIARANISSPWTTALQQPAPILKKYDEMFHWNFQRTTRQIFDDNSWRAKCAWVDSVCLYTWCSAFQLPASPTATTAWARGEEGEDKTWRMSPATLVATK